MSFYLAHGRPDALTDYGSLRTASSGTRLREGFMEAETRISAICGYGMSRV